MPAFLGVEMAVLSSCGKTYKEAKERPHITAISLCPGWLQTGERSSLARSRGRLLMQTRVCADMGGDGALYPVSVGVEGIIKTVTALKHEDSGSFLNFKGERVPW